MSQDPFLDRESEKYANPIPSREFILDHLAKREKPASRDELAIELNIEGEEQQEALRRRLRAMERDGQLVFTRRQCYALPERLDLLKGTVIGHRDGYGFLRVEGRKDDLYLSSEQMKTCIHGDQVLAQPLGADRKGRREARIVRVLVPKTSQIVGRYFTEAGVGFVVPDDSRLSFDILIPPEEIMGARMGFVVVVELTQRPTRRTKAVGKIVEVLGDNMGTGMAVDMALRTHEIPYVWPPAVEKQVAGLKEQVPEEAKAGRVDLRNLPLVTIDGEDAKDLDDAISLTKEGDIYHLGVHIADVSNYVQYNSALDREALKRGTSVYLADRVVPMLPERLSNGICSLNQGEDRLALSCLMDINEKGKVVSHQIAETVINVNERMCYTDVKNILEDTDEEAKKRYEALIPMFFMMKELSGILRNSRHHRGSIDFDFPESKIILNAAGKAIDVKPYEANVATKIIEDFMLMANETVAQEYCTEEIPFVYRTHDNPDPEKVESLLTLLHNQGVKIQKAKEEITPKEIQQIIESIEGLPNEAMISRLVLRSMKQAKYTTECSGHFGLAAKYYCHFTSPIRRYPDLQIHRIIKDNLRGRLMREGRTEHYAEILDEVARQSSVCERRADEAERESDKLKKAEYMSYHLGEEFEGIISGVTGWGLYVELPNTVEGLVHVNTLRDDYYIFDQETYELRGEMTKKVYKLGDKVCVRVADADKMLKTVDFELVADIWNDEEEN